MTQFNNSEENTSRRASRSYVTLIQCLMGLTWKLRLLIALTRGWFQTHLEFISTTLLSTVHPDSTWQHTGEKREQVVQDKVVSLLTLNICMRRVCCITAMVSAW